MESVFYQMDCMEVLSGFPDNFFGLAIIDPPYGIGENGDRNHSRGKLAKAKDYPAFAGGDTEAPAPEYFAELFRVSRNQIIWGANHFIERICRNSSAWIVWDKLNGESDFADCELARTSFPGAVRKFEFRWAGMLQGNMKKKEIRIHPTQKPAALYRWLLNTYANEGDIILDTHVGSASSLVACEDLGYKYVGFELNPHYYQTAKKRLSVFKSQMKLF